MAVILQSTYLAIANDYDSAREYMLRGKARLLDAVQTIVNLTGTGALAPEVDLLNVFWDTYQTNNDFFSGTTTLISSVRAINNHVLNEGGYANLDAYYEDATGDLGGFSVPCFWGQMSISAGYSIDGANIDPCPTDFDY